MLALKPDVVLAVEFGSFDRETEVHRAFHADRAKGYDWFHPSPDLLTHVAEVRRASGPVPDWTPLPRGGDRETRRRNAALRREIAEREAAGEPVTVSLADLIGLPAEETQS